MVRYLFLNFLRSKAYGLGLLLLFISGLISLEIGLRFLQRAALVREKTAKHQEESIQRYVGYFNQDMGDLMYYLKFGLENELSPLAGLSVGQRDIYPAVQSFTIRNIEEQRYTTDLMNPLYQLLGTMDFSFVIIYLFPLVIISFGFNLISEEKERGTWSLIRSQSFTPLPFLRIKFGIRLVAVLLVLLTLLVVGKFYLMIPLDVYFFRFGFISVLYLLFWFALTWWVVSLQKGSSFNAQALLGFWVVLLLLIPAGINSLQRQLYPIPEALAAVMENREGYHSQWDKPKEPTLEKFYQKYPQYAEFKHPQEKDFSWLWFFAMQQQGDDLAAEEVEGMKEKLKKRQTLTQWIGWFIPTIHTQAALSSLSLSDMENYLNYLTAMERFHEDLKAYFFPKVFGGTAVGSEQWQEFTLEKFQDSPSKGLLEQVLSLAILTIGLLVWSAFNLKRVGFNTN